MYLGRFLFKELAHTVPEAGKSKICRVEEQVEDPGQFFLFLNLVLNWLDKAHPIYEG